MPDFITLTCPSCGARLKVTDQIHLLACRNCGNEHMVVRDMSSIYLAPIAQDVRGIRAGVDKTAAELAVARLTREIADLEKILRVAESKNANEVIPPGTWEGIFQTTLGITFILMAGGLIFSKFGFAFVVGWLFVASLVAYLVISERRVTRAIKKRTARIESILADLNTKREQYRKNRQIAES